MAPKKITAICATAAVAAGLAAPVAADATKRRPADSQVNVTQLNADGAAGILESTRAACQGGRQVTLYKEDTINGGVSGRPIAQTTTRGDGSWSIPSLLYSNEYYVGVDPARTKRFNCAASASQPQMF